MTQSDFYVKNLSTPASLRSDRGWPVSFRTSGRFGSEQPAGFSGISNQGGDEVPAFRKIHRKTGVGVIVEKVASYYGISVDRITQLDHPPHRGSQVAMYLARKKTDLSLNEIAAIFGRRHYTAVSVVFRRVEARRQRDPGFDRELGKIERELS